MKTFSGFEASYALCKYNTISYIRVNRVFVLKWRPLAVSEIVAPLADVFSSVLQIARSDPNRHFRRVICHSPDFFKRDALHTYTYIHTHTSHTYILVSARFIDTYRDTVSKNHEFFYLFIFF